jgi:hypothetical protein
MPAKRKRKPAALDTDETVSGTAPPNSTAANTLSANTAGAGGCAGAAQLFARDLNTDRSKQLFALLPQVSSALSYDVVALIVSYDKAARVYSVDGAGAVCVWDVAERQYLAQQWRVPLTPKAPDASPLCVVPCGSDHRYLAVRSDKQFAVYEAVASGGDRSMQYELMSTGLMASPTFHLPSMVCAVSRDRLLISHRLMVNSCRLCRLD